MDFSDTIKNYRETFIISMILKVKNNLYVRHFGMHHRY